METEDFDIAIGPSADGFIEDIFARIKNLDMISPEEISQSIKELADNHWGTQYCFRNQDLVDNYICYKSVEEIDPKMSYPAPEVITEYVIGAFAEAHDISVSDARVFLDKFDCVSFVQENYKIFAYMMSIDMVKTLRNYIRRCGGVCPPIVRKIDG